MTRNKQASTPPLPKPVSSSGPNPDKGIHDSSEHTGFTSPPHRLGTSQDFGDREVSHTAEALEQQAAANHADTASIRPAGTSAPGHGSPRPSPEQKRSVNPD